MDTTLRMQVSVDEKNNAGEQRARNHWHFWCYFLHAFLIALHIFLLVVSALGHAEHQITLPFDNGTYTGLLSGGLQAFYILYTALLVFVTQRLVLSAAFSSPRKLTQIHDICGAWSGFGAALSALWSQTKVTSSILSVGIVTVYLACVSLLHVTSSIIMQLQAFNSTVTTTAPAVAGWPDSSVDLSSLNWMTVTTLVPFLRSLYGNTTNGLANNTLYDVPTQSFANATVTATTLNAHCGVLTNISIDAIDGGTWNVSVSMTNVDPFSIHISYPPLHNEIWFSPSIECIAYSQSPVCQNFILYLVSSELEIDDSVNGVSHVYLNGTYGPNGQNISTPISFVGCSLDTTTSVAALDSVGSQLLINSSNLEQSTDAAWSTFSPGGDTNLTRGISNAMLAANSLPLSPYCQPVMTTEIWDQITAFNAYMSSALGMGSSFCNVTTFPPQYRNGTSLAQYTSTPSFLNRGQMENVVSQIAAEFIWLAGELGNAGGGFDRQTEESQITQYVLQWRLNINSIPVIISLCASVVPCALAVFMLWDCNARPTAKSAAGMLEIMWLGSRSRILRDRLKDVQDPSMDSLRASSLFETVFWARTTHVHVNNESNDPHAATPLHNVGIHLSGSSSLESLEVVPGQFPHSSKPPHIRNTSYGRYWCYVLHIVLVLVHIVLLVLLTFHPEHNVIIPIKSNILTSGLGALLEAVYTLYSALLVVIVQRLALSRIVSKRRKLTTVHDVSGAWMGIGTAIRVLWQQRQLRSSIREVAVVVTYLASILILNIGSSSILQWQAFNSTVVDILPSYLALPSSAINIGQLGWSEIFPIVESLGQDTDVTTYGLSNSTLYDIPQVPIDITYSEASVNATTLDVQCGLVPNLTLSYLSFDTVYKISFSQNGTDNGNFLEPPIWKDVIYPITPNIQCATCPQTLFYMITTGVDVDESVGNSFSVDLNWTYTPSGGSPQISKTVTYIGACSVGANTVPATLDLQEYQLTSTIDQTSLSNSTSWSAWTPGNATDLSVGLVTAFTNIDLNRDASGMFKQGNSSVWFTEMDIYMMNVLGLDLASANTSSATQSSADPSVTLSPSQLENAIAQTAAKFLWLAGELGQTAGGFQRTMGESQLTRNVLLWRLHLNMPAVIFASVASFIALISVPFIIGKRPSKEYAPLISGTSVLESLWLAAQSEELYSRLEVVEKPRLDKLRAAGMFEISLGDIGRPSLVAEAVD